MLFNTLTFIFFHAVLLLAYWASPRQGLRVLFLSIGSLVFYGWYYWPGLFVIGASIIINYFLGIEIEKRSSKKWLTAAVIINLFSLSYFKYSHFLINAVIDFFALFGIGLEIPTPPQWLPLGISFFTFQVIAYLVDIYQGKIKAERNPLLFICFEAFYGQLIAGPIVRSHEFMPQLKSKRQFDIKSFQLGFFYIIAGLTLKTTVADTLAQFVDYGFPNINELSTSLAWLTAYAFSFQILCDFWGYSTIAVGVGYMYGIKLPINFNSPYSSKSIQEFWRRWHITLSIWLRDYLYIPLGGNRNNKTNRNLLITMTLGGLWHGANWNFLIWGFFHGIWLGIERNFNSIAKSPKRLSKLVNFFKIFLVFNGVTLLWVFFRAPTFTNATEFLQKMLIPPFSSGGKTPDTLVSIMVLFTIFSPMLAKYLIDSKFLTLTLKKQLSISIVLLMLLLAYSQARLDFIYFVF